MPIFEIEDPRTRKVVRIEADREPTESEAQEALEAFEPSPAAPAPSAPKLSPSGRTPEQEALAQQFIQRERRPTLQKVIEGAVGLGGALAQPFVSAFKALPAIPEVAASPEKLIPTGAEASRRLGIDILNIARGIGNQLPSLETAAPAFAKSGTMGVLSEALRQKIAGLAPRNPSEEEVQAFVEQAPFEQALAEERGKVAFEGAQPELAEAVTQAVEFAPPVKGLTKLLGGSVTKAAPARILRSAIKPPKQLGARLEKATQESLSDIYHSNPNADKLGSMPLEGFQQAVAAVQKRVGTEIDDGLKQSGVPINGGDDIAQALTSRADKLERAGQPKENIQILRDRASDFLGKVDDMESLREATTLANRELSPLFQKTREAANPLRAQADTIANEIIAKTGGETLNKALESVKGPEGANLRKKWSNLTLIEKQASDQLNKLINSAPAELRSSLVGAITSTEGMVGLVGLVQGYAAGIIPVATSAAKAWSRRADRALRDSNSLVTAAYEKLRASPPPAP